MTSKDIDAIIYAPNEIKGGKVNIDFDVLLWKHHNLGGEFSHFAWEIELPKQKIGFSSTNYCEETDTESFYWQDIEFHPFEWRVKIKEGSGIVNFGGFVLSLIEIYPQDKKITLVF